MPSLANELASFFYPALKLLSALARDHGVRVFLCGGAVRDLLRGARPPDMDLAIQGDVFALARDLAARLPATLVILHEDFASCRLVFQGIELDLTGLRAPTLEGDLALRDFTINAMALDLDSFLANTGQIIDPTGGEKDLETGVLRPAGLGVLRTDPLRVLRGFRFMSTLHLNPGSGVLFRLAGAGPGIFRTARERIAHEWMALMAGSQAPRAVRAMDQAMVLTRLLPGLARGRGVVQNPYHHLDVFEHSLACLDSLGVIAADPVAYFGASGAEVGEYLSSPRTRALTMTAAFLHDLGKPPTAREKEPGWCTFHRHDALGASLACQAARGLGLGKDDAATIAHLVREHMRPFHLLGAEKRTGLTKRAARRLLAGAGKDLAGLFALAMADTMAGRGPLRPLDAEERLADLFTEICGLRDRELAAALAAPPLINGNDLMAALDIGPGPEMGEILSQVREAQLDGEVRDRGAALALASKLLCRTQA